MVCSSGLHVVGIQPLLDTIVSYVPSPAERDFPAVSKDGTDTTVKASDAAPATAFVWKTIADPFAGRITMLRTVSGTLKSDTTVHNLTRDSSSGSAHLIALQGRPRRTSPS